MGILITPLLTHIQNTYSNYNVSFTALTFDDRAKTKKVTDYT